MCTWRGKPRSYTFGQKKEKESLEKEVYVWEQKENKGKKRNELGQQTLPNWQMMVSYHGRDFICCGKCEIFVVGSCI